MVFNNGIRLSVFFLFCFTVLLMIFAAHKFLVLCKLSSINALFWSLYRCCRSHLVR